MSSEQCYSAVSVLSFSQTYDNEEYDLTVKPSPIRNRNFCIQYYYYISIPDIPDSNTLLAIQSSKNKCNLRRENQILI